MEIQNRISQIKDEKDDARQLMLIKELFRQIQMSSKSVVDEISGGVAISNFDEVASALHNETNRSISMLMKALKDLKLSNEKQATILSEITKESQQRYDDEFQTIKIRRPLDKVHVLNPQDFPKTEEVRVSNLSELKELFNSLEEQIEKSLKIDIPAPQVNVEAPVVNIPEQKIEFPDFETEAIVAELIRGLKKIRTNNTSNPLFVRLSDLDKVLSKLEEVREASKNVMLGFPGSLRIQNATGGIVDFNSLTIVTPDDASHQAQFDYSGGTSVVYAGYAPRGVTSSSSGWLLRKFTYDGNNNVTQIQIAYDTWNNRASASYA